VLRYRVLFAACAILAAALALSACGGGSSSSGGTTNEGGNSTESPSEGSGEGPSQKTVQYGLKITGGKAEAADSSLPPVKIAFLNQEGAVPSYAELRKVQEASVEFVNNNLGGIEGHPLEFTYCVVQGEADGQKCAAQFLNEGFEVIQYGEMVEGEASFFKTIGAKVPVLIDWSTATASLTAKNAYQYAAGGPAVLNGMAYGVTRNGYKSVALVSSSNPTGKFAAEEILGPEVEKSGAKVKTVFISDSASQPEFTSALQASGASTADVVMQLPPGGAQCNYVIQGMKQLGIEKPLIDTYYCYAPDVLEATGGGPENVEVWNTEQNPHVSSPEQEAYVDATSTYGAEAAAFEGNASSAWRDVLMLAKFGNELGFKNLNKASWEKAISSYKGPAPMVPGTMECGKNPLFATPCGSTAVGSEYVNGEWINVGEFNVLTSKGAEVNAGETVE
jgi:branched-chain amino acid transport system substrate-binding protein